MVRHSPHREAGSRPKSAPRRVEHELRDNRYFACLDDEWPAHRLTAPAVALRDVRKVHGHGDAAVVALDGISIRLARGSFTAIMGPSGSGKSTFLHIAAGLDRPTSGAVALRRH